MSSRPFVIFSINGIVYALGDYLEMSAIGGLPAAAYQILQQSRIILTALLMIPAKGVYQTRLQWTLLAILTFSMSTQCEVHTGFHGGPLRGPMGRMPYRAL